MCQSILRDDPEHWSCYADLIITDVSSVFKVNLGMPGPAHLFQVPKVALW